MFKLFFSRNRYIFVIYSIFLKIQKEKMVKNFLPYKFIPPLIEGIIQERIGSFIMMVKLKNNEIVKCHCPTMCSIGNIKSLKNLSCLLSYNPSKERNTHYTVEAISLDSNSKKNKKWIGINQTKANKYFEYFLKQGRFKEIFPKEVKNIQREKFFQKSKFDFKIDDTFLEIKTPLHFLNMKIPKNIKIKKTKLSPGNRLMKHINDLKEYLKLKKRAIMVMICMYDGDSSRPEKKDNCYKFDEVNNGFKECYKLGLETYQINLKMNENQIDVDKVFKTNE